MSLLNDIAQGKWMMSFDALASYSRIASKIANGENFDFIKNTKSLLSVYDNNGQRVLPEQNGSINAPKGSVAVIKIEGVLIKESDYCTQGAVDIVKELEAANNNPNIIAIVAYFNGPGGSVSAIPPFLDFANFKKKPIVGLYDQCCSAHLYSMLAISDHVMAENSLSATIGSVGVVLSFVDNRKYLEEKGYVFHEIYPEESKNKNESFLLALEGKYDMIKKEMLSPLAVKFQEAVKKARPNLIEKDGVLTGNTFYTDKALELKLIDGVGNLQQAMNVARMMSEMKTLYNK